MQGSAHSLGVRWTSVREVQRSLAAGRLAQKTTSIKVSLP